MIPDNVAPRPAGESDSLMHAVRVIRERWWVIALAIALSIGLALALSLRAEDSYTATARVLFGSSQLSESVLGFQRDSGEPERLAATEQQVAVSRAVADRARKILGTRTGPEALAENLTVEAEENANVMVFTYEAGEPVAAASGANAFAEGYRQFRKDSEVRQLEAAERSLRAQLAQFRPGSDERTAVSERLAQVSSIRASADGGTDLIGRAEAPLDRASPQPKRDAILGLVFGLVAGLTAAFLIDLFDRRVKTVDQFENLYRGRALATVPQSSFAARSPTDRAAAFEPYRVLRNALGFAELTSSINVVMVTSALAEEGKTTVSLNLARAIALSGQRVVLVECDLRRPSLSRVLELNDGTGGLTTALVGRRDVTSLLRPAQHGLPQLSVLPSGPLPPNAGELLRSQQMGTLLDELTADGTMVVLDTPPLVPVADAHALLDLRQVDACIVVARAYKTTRENAARARAILDQHRLEPLGLVITGTSDAGTYGYYGEGGKDRVLAGEPELRAPAQGAPTT